MVAPRHSAEYRRQVVEPFVRIPTISSSRNPGSGSVGLVSIATVLMGDAPEVSVFPTSLVHVTVSAVKIA